MRKVWVVVANSSRSKIYRAENAEKLVEHMDLAHEESHLPERELVSDKQGRGHTGTGSMEEKTSAKMKESIYFAREIAYFLEKGAHLGEYERLYLIANPPFAFLLRDSLKENVAKQIASEIHKDLTLMRPEQIRQYLPPVL